MTKNEIVLHMARELKMRQMDIKRIVQMTLDSIIDVLAAEQRLELRNFGVFEVKSRRPRKARNPRTGATVMVPARYAVTFKPGKMMEEKVYSAASKRNAGAAKAASTSSS